MANEIVKFTILHQESGLRIGTIAWNGAPQLSREMAFQYDDEWIERGFSLGADLPLRAGTLFPLSTPLLKTDALLAPRQNRFGFICDMEPGNWVTDLVRRANLLGLKSASEANISSAGALFASAGHVSSRFSGLSFLPNALKSIEFSGKDLERTNLKKIITKLAVLQSSPVSLKAEDVRFLIDRTTDIGGTSPKALVSSTLEHPGLWVLRVQNPHHPFNTARWTSLINQLAGECGLLTLEHRYLPVSDGAYLERRLDRVTTDTQAQPRTCLSAATLVRCPAGRLPTWLDVADILNREGSSPKSDLQALFLRLLFSTLVLNRRAALTDIWFYRESGGWRLAPLHAPVPELPLMRARLLPTPIAGNDNFASPQSVIELSPYFATRQNQAKAHLMQMRRVLSGWQNRALQMGADRGEIAMMQPVFFSE